MGFDEIDKSDVALAGEKGARLGDMVKAGFRVPKGFVVSSRAYFSFVQENKLGQRIEDLLSTAHFERPDSLSQIYNHIKKLFMRGGMSEEMIKEIYFSYKKLGGIFHNATVMMQTSNIMEDLYKTHTTGHQNFYIKPDLTGTKITGEANLILKIKEGWASVFEPAELIYRHERKINHFRDGVAIIIQKILKFDHKGFIYTIDPVNYDKTKLIIKTQTNKIQLPANSQLSWRNYCYEVSKADLEIIKKAQGHKNKLTRNQILGLAKIAKEIEYHYYFPKKIEWGIEKNKIYIIQTGDITGHGESISKNEKQSAAQTQINNNCCRFAVTNELKPSQKLQLLLKGISVSPGIVKGKVSVVKSGWQVDKIDPGDVLVAMQTDNSYLSVMKKAGAVITDHGGRTSHCAIVCRELGIPAIAGTGNATKLLKDGMIVTVNGILGEIYSGSPEQKVEQHSLGKNYLGTATKIYANFNQEGFTAKAGFKNIDGVNIFGDEIVVADKGVKSYVYSERLAEKISMFCREFAPRPVIYRLSDYKVNEQNFILGNHGIFRHIYDPEILKIEIEAVKIVRQKKELKNLWMMIPFCRTVKELVEIKQIIISEGIHRSPTFKLWMTIEVPSNVILIDKFVEAGIDGVSIGLDNLTKLILGIDRDNIETAAGFDEKSPAVMWALEKIIKTCQKNHISSSIYSQGLALNTDMLEKLVGWGISSLSVTSEEFDTIRENVFKIERELVEKKYHGKN